MTKKLEPVPHSRDPNVDFIDVHGQVWKDNSERVYAPLPDAPDNTERRRYETPDPTPMQPPVGHNPQPSPIQLQLQQLALHQRQLAEMARSGEGETFEEADDFDVDDDFDPATPYEEFFVRGVGSYDPNFPAVIRQINEDLARAKEAQSPEPTPTPPPPAPKPASQPSRAPKAPDPALDGPDPK